MTPRQCIDTCRIALALWLASAPALCLPVIERVLDTPCRALGLDHEPYVAALGPEAVTVMDKRGTHQEPLPEALRGPGIDVGVFFGRDYRVRVAGTAHTPQGDEVRYYRSLPGGLRPALDELGPLGKRGGPGLVALLGTTDPEIVCRPGESCLLKRVSGWTKASAPAGLSRVGLSLGQGWAIAGASFFRLGKDWQPVLPPGSWQKADDAFLRGDEACVVEHDSSRLHHFDGKAWHASASPVTGPRSLWGSADALWIGGDGGAVMFDDGAFRKLDGVAHVAQVLGRDAQDVWLCSAEGVFRARTPSPQRN
jgi:hypothetical protein